MATTLPAETVATLSSDELHSASSVTSWTVPDGQCAIAPMVNRCVAGAALTGSEMVTRDGGSAGDSTTVICALFSPLSDGFVATIVAVPGERPVTTAFGQMFDRQVPSTIEMSATEGLDDRHVTGRVQPPMRPVLVIGACHRTRSPRESCC